MLVKLVALTLVCLIGWLVAGNDGALVALLLVAGGLLVWGVWWGLTRFGSAVASASEAVGDTEMSRAAERKPDQPEPSA